MSPGASTICAFGVPGVRTSVFDTDDGVDITFNVMGDAGELQRRVHDALADRGPYCMHPETRAIARRVHATVTDEPRGLIIHAVPIDPKDLDDVREAIRRRVENATRGDCS